jgi:hypothetical protein
LIFLLGLARLSLLNSMHWPQRPEQEAGLEDAAVEEDEEVAADTNLLAFHSCCVRRLLRKTI